MSDKFTFIVPKNKHESDYIGFNLKKEKPAFFFPCQYLDVEQLDERSKELIYKREAKKIIMLLKRIQQEYFLGGNNGELLQFYSMIWLIQDFVDHGYYMETETVYKNSSVGKINWKKTLKQNKIYINNGNVIFPGFVRNKVMIDDSRVLTQIYKACLSFSVERLGFIYGVEKTEKSIFDITLKDKDFIVYYLTNELNNTNRDYKKNLLRHLLSIVNHQNFKTQDLGYSIYDSEFEYVFEFLINQVFGTENVKAFYNSYSYYLPEQYSASKLRPDTIIKDTSNKTYYIVDAKYYNYGYTLNNKDLPQSSSISKQIGYNHYLKDNLPDEEEDYCVKSIFVLPYSSTVKGEYIKHIGYAQRDKNRYARTIDNIDDKVAVCLIDLKVLIDTYLSNNNKINYRTLINCIK